MNFGDESIKTYLKKGGLTAVFNKSNPPIIWRFDIERDHNFALAMKGEEGNWQLEVTSGNGNFTNIAHFRAREDADAAFEAMQTVLTGGKISILNLILKIGLAILLVILIGTFLVDFSRSYRASRQTVATRPGMLSHLAIIPPGVPMPADQVLQAPVGAFPTSLSQQVEPAASRAPIPEGVPLSADDALKPN